MEGRSVFGGRWVAELQVLHLVAELLDRLLGQLQSILELVELVLHLGLGLEDLVQRPHLLLVDCNERPASKCKCNYLRHSLRNELWETIFLLKPPVASLIILAVFITFKIVRTYYKNTKSLVYQ